MFILRRLVPISRRIQITQRFYSRKNTNTHNANMIQIHQETLRYISPCAKIKVDSDIYVKVSSADLHNYPDGDALVAELHGGPVKNCTATMSVKVSDDECNVEVILRKLVDSTNFHCELAVPVKACLDINTRHGAQVMNTYGDEVIVRGVRSIKTNNIRAEKIVLTSEGNINCQGILLGKETVVETKNKGNIILDKPQGDHMKCRTSEGNITTNCSYVESSKFETDTGCLDLKNVHKRAAVLVNQKGELKMTGVHGNLMVSMNEGIMDIQLSELQGKNLIESNNLTSCVINISDDIEKSTSLDIKTIGDPGSSTIKLDGTLEHLSLALDESRQQLRWPLDQERPNELKVISRSSLALGKSSWMDTMRLQMIEKKTNTS